MASSRFGLRAGYLDAAEQEVVFCHECRFEWFRDEHESISCPSCNSGATEIVRFVCCVHGVVWDIQIAMNWL